MLVRARHVAVKKFFAARGLHEFQRQMRCDRNLLIATDERGKIALLNKFADYSFIGNLV